MWATASQLLAQTRYCSFTPPDPGRGQDSSFLSSLSTDEGYLYHSVERMGRFKDAVSGAQRDYQRGIDGRDVEALQGGEDAGVRMGDDR